MEEAGGSRRKRRWVLANVVGGVALIVVLAVVLAGSPGSGEAPGIDTSLQSHGPPAAHPARACTQFQRMVNECPDPTTTTTTSTSPPTTPGPSGSGSTTYSYSTSSSGSTATPSTAPAAQAAPADPGAAATAAGSAAVAADPAACSGATPPVGAPGGSWHCTFDDEFNGTSLDTSKWAAMTTYGSNYRTGPLFHQVCYVNSPSTISESGGYLDLSVVQTAQPVTCPGVYNSDGTTDVVGGEVISYNLFSQQYGFFEASAEMPASSVPGLQDTLWLYPENETLYGPWPDSGEIDFGEWYSNYANNRHPGQPVSRLAQRSQLREQHVRDLRPEPGRPVPHVRVCCGRPRR